MTFDTWFPLTDLAAFPHKPGIYVIRNKLDGMEYVGMSTSIARRLVVHRCGKVANSRLHRAMCLHGKVNFEVAYLCLPIDRLNEAEKEVIAIRCTLSPGGYNLTMGGEGTSGWVQPKSHRDKISKANTGKKHSEATKQKIREIKLALVRSRPAFRHSQETRDKMSVLRRAREPISEQTREAMSKAQRGKKLSESTRRAIGLANSGRKMLDTTKAAMIAAIKGVQLPEEHKAKLREAMQGRKSSEDAKNKAHATRRLRADPNLNNCVFVWEKESSIAKVFPSFKDAAAYLEVREKSLREWCRIGAPKYLELTVAREYL